MKKKDIASYTFRELEEEMKLSGEKGFRAKQIYEWIHVKMAESFGEMTNLSKSLREKLKEYPVTAPVGGARSLVRNSARVSEPRVTSAVMPAALLSAVRSESIACRARSDPSSPTASLMQ